MKGINSPYRNSKLFSHDFLEGRLFALAEWDIPEEKLKTAHERLRDLFDRAIPATSEASLEDDLIRPILSDILGFSYLVQPSTSIFKTHRKPDYALFLTEEEKQAAKPFDGEKKLFENALAVADAKAWEVDLDTIGPASQMHDYILISNVRWGMITNGRRWRLYQRDTVHELDTFYEVNLEKIIAADDLSSLKYFLVFFRAQSFLRNSFLDRVLTESVEYARRVGAELKENVFEALRLLCQGFLDGKQDLSAEDLPAIHENGLILLYRVLFLLYAESDRERELLPLSNPEYREQIGLCALKREVAEQRIWLPETHNLWGRFKDLFHLIHSGNERLGIYEYNGGLFDPERYPFLERYVIGDRYLAEALRLLTCTQAEGHRGFLDYSALDVRELGSVYEGLLEHKVILQEEELAWERDKSQRKKTGSYYTPEYIVSYIVGETLGPLVDEIKQGLNEERTALEEEIHRARGENRRLLKQQQDDLSKKARERVLDLKVLDPAMGSGHFLVSACDYLARRIAELEAELTEKETEEAVQELKRTVAIRCLHGVDLNPLATELAKLSLWLHTVAKGKPLSFLDHHLRTGNSLIGATVKDLTRPPSGKAFEIGLWESSFTRDLLRAVQHLNFIKEGPSFSRADITVKKEEWELVNAWIGKYKQAANVWLSPHFGNKLADEDYPRVIEAAAANALEKVADKPFFIQAQKVAAEKRFFHWDLEFPDVFFDRFGRPLANPGFDAVIGNPPWGGNLSKQEKKFLRTLQTDTNIPNTFIYFQKKAEDITRISGYQSFLVPDSLLIKEYPVTRKHLVRKRTLRQIIFIRNTGIPALKRPFPYVNHDVIALIINKDSLRSGGMTLIRFVEGVVYDIQRTYCRNIRQSLFNDEELDFRFNLKLDTSKTTLKQHIDSSSWKLHEKFESHEGVHSGNIRGKLFLPPGSSSPNSTVKPLIMGTSHGDKIGRYQLTWAGWHVHYDPNLIDNQNSEYASLREERIFLSPKLFVVRTGDIFALALDRKQFYASNNLFCLLKRLETKEPYELEFILGLLNSSLLQWYLHAYIAPRFGHLYTETKIKHLDLLPIRRIAFTTPKEERERLVEEGKRLYSETLGSLRFEGEVRSLDDKLNRR